MDADVNVSVSEDVDVDVNVNEDDDASVDVVDGANAIGVALPTTAAGLLRPAAKRSGPRNDGGDFLRFVAPAGRFSRDENAAWTRTSTSA